MAKKSKKGNVVSIDFTGVEAGGVLIDEGKYEVEVTEVKQEESKEGNPYLSWEFKVISEEGKGSKLWHNTSLQQQSLWSLRGLLEALGVEVPEEEMDLDLDDLVGRTIGAEVTHEEYNGKNKARISDFFTIAEEEAEEKPSKKKAKEEPEEEEKPSKKDKKADKKKVKKIAADTILEMDEEELGEVVTEQELEVDLDEFTTLRRKRNAVVEALEEKGLIEG